jgi:hypothetical protein
VGASTFEQYADGAEVAAAFRTARNDAAAEHGDGGYSGSLAEKHDYVVITRQAMDLDDAYRLARDLITRQDPRIDDTWGPAGAIGVRNRTRTVVVDDLPGTLIGGDLTPARRSPPAGCAPTPHPVPRRAASRTSPALQAQRPTATESRS